MIDVEEMNKKIDKGVKWLDENAPTWRTTVKPDKLEMRWPCSCMIGRCFGSFWSKFMWPASLSGVTTFGPGRLSFDEAIAMGFALPFDTATEAADWLVLNRLWQDRLEEQQPSPTPVPQRRTAEVVAV